MTTSQLRKSYGLNEKVNIVPLRGNFFYPALRPHQGLSGYRAAAVFDYGFGEKEIIVARHGGIIARHVKGHPGLTCDKSSYVRW